MAKTVSLRSDICFRSDVTQIGRGGESGVGEKTKRRRRRNGGGEEFPRGKESAEVEATTGDDDHRRPNVSVSFEEYINGIEWEKNIEDQVFSDAQMVAKMFTDILKEESGNGEDDDGLVFGEGKLVEEFWNETGSQSTTATSSLSSSECATNDDDDAEKAPDVTVCGSPSAPNLRLGSSGGEDEVSGLTCTCNASGCHVAGGFRVRRLQDSVSLTPDAALSSSSSTASLATTGSSVYGTLSDVSLAEALDQAKRRRKEVFSPVKVLSAHNFGSRAQETTSVHPRAAKQRSAYEGCCSSSSSSTLSFTTGSLCRVRSTDSLEGWKRERGRSRSSSYPSQQPALSWSSPNIQFSSQLHAKGHRRGGKGAGRGGLPVLLAWHLILLVTLLRGNTSSIIPVLEKLIC